MQMNPVLFLSFSSLCVKMRRNDITKRKMGGEGGDDSILYRKSLHPLHPIGIFGI